MDAAFAQAEAAGARGEVPVGAVVTRGGVIVAADGNRVIERTDPTAHAEVLVMRAAAAALKTSRLDDCDLYVTLEPCPMCAAAIALAHINKLSFGAYDPKSGGVDHGPRIFTQPTCHHRPEVIGGLDEVRAGALLKMFFAARR